MNKAGNEEKVAVRVYGLDTLRFFCAFWVVISHTGLPPVFGEATHQSLGVVDRVLAGLINGPAAVIVFFVISGFFIHFPQRSLQQKLSIGPFYTRRFIRLGLPLLATLGLCFWLQISLQLLTQMVLWSLIAEGIYYLLYPLLLRLRMRFRWQTLIIAAYGLAFGVILTQPFASNYPSFGHGLNWVVGLPCWLLGCLLAEKSDALTAPPTYSIWGWRLLIFAASAAAAFIRFHVNPRLPIPLGNPWLLDGFALLVFLWLGQEIRYFRNHKPSPIWEWAGTWSYSIYLLHILIGNASGRFLPLPGKSGDSLHIVVDFAVMLMGAYVFYRLVEYPSQLLAASLGKRTKESPVAEKTVPPSIGAEPVK